MVINLADQNHNEEYITVSYDGVEYCAFIRDECINTPIDIEFINRNGGNQNITFFQERRDSMMSMGSMYESSSAQPSTGVHQFEKYNVNAKSSFDANTGYIDQQANELIRQLVLSERVWIDGIPVNVKTESVDYKTVVNDRLVNYTMKFEYSYNEINTI